MSLRDGVADLVEAGDRILDLQVECGELKRRLRAQREVLRAVEGALARGVPSAEQARLVLGRVRAAILAIDAGDIARDPLQARR